MTILTNLMAKDWRTVARGIPMSDAGKCQDNVVQRSSVADKETGFEIVSSNSGTVQTAAPGDTLSYFVGPATQTNENSYWNNYG